jgi:hypothetical protein
MAMIIIAIIEAECHTKGLISEVAHSLYNQAKTSSY